MPMNYACSAVPDSAIPKASSPIFQPLPETYASEAGKVISAWHGSSPGGISYKPHPRAGSVEEIMRHQLLSERRILGRARTSALRDPSASPVSGRFCQANTSASISTPGVLRGPKQRLVAGARSLFRRSARTDLDLLAARASHRSPLYAIGCLSAFDQLRCSLDLWTHGRCHLEGS